MRNKTTRFIAVLLSLLMVISLIPTFGLTVEAAAKPKLAKKTSNITIGGTAQIKVKNAPKGAKIGSIILAQITERKPIRLHLTAMAEVLSRHRL